MTMLEAIDVNKSFKGMLALRDISLNIEEGEVFGLIGPDGAGKSTFIRIVCTLLKPDTGKVRVSGYDVVKDYRKIRDLIGYVPGRFSLYQDLTVEENLNLFATIFGTTLKDNYYLIKDIYQMLEPFKDRRAGDLSGGMKQKLALSCSLIHKPRLLVLDEPTTGVDPVSRKEFWEMLSRLKNEGITILVSTPYMDEASQCDRVALIQSAEIMSVNKPGKLVEEFPLPVFSIISRDKISLLEFLRNSPKTHSANLFGESIHFVPTSESTDEVALGKLLEKQGFDVIVSRVQPQIEDCFIELMESKEAVNNGN